MRSGTLGLHNMLMSRLNKRHYVAKRNHRKRVWTDKLKDDIKKVYALFGYISANKMQVLILEANIKALESITVPMSVDEKNGYILDWISNNAKAFRAIYDSMSNFKYHVSFRYSGELFRIEGLLSEPELIDLLEDTREVKQLSIIRIDGWNTCRTK